MEVFVFQGLRWPKSATGSKSASIDPRAAQQDRFLEEMECVKSLGPVLCFLSF